MNDATLSSRFMAIILSLLSIVTVICVYINYTTTINYGSGQMQRNAANYEYQLSEWINTQKSLLDMFCSNISTNPDKLNDYNGIVGYLDRITKQFPEISASYLANPDMEHTVIMNTGWEPDEDWHVEERDWYKELMASENDWIISSPYLDEQTGFYCVTFAKRVYNETTGEFLGNFGIDFYAEVRPMTDVLFGKRNAFPDTYEILAYLDRAGIEYAIGSTTDNDSLMHCLEQNHLSFRYIFTSEDMRVYKPSPAFYTTILERTGWLTSECLFVGDSLTDDVEGPQSVGMKAALIDRKRKYKSFTSVRPDHLIHSLTELSEIIQSGI